MITGIIASLVSVHFVTLIAIMAHDHLMSYEVNVSVVKGKLLINSVKKNYRG